MRIRECLSEKRSRALNSRVNVAFGEGRGQGKMSDTQTDQTEQVSK